MKSSSVIKKISSYFYAIGNSYSEIFFFEDHLLGLVLLVTTFINPNAGFSGLLCLLSAHEFARFLGLRKLFKDSGYYTYNPLLVGLSIGYIYKLSFFTVFLVVSAGIMTFIVTISLANILYYFFKLPVLNLPFVFVSTIIYLASYKYSNLFLNEPFITLAPFFKRLELILPLGFVGLTKSLGALLFCPHFLGGMIFLTIIFLVSRILFILAVGGYFLGVFILSCLEGSYYQAVSDLSAFNFSLIAMAIGGVFLIPSPRSYFLGFLAVSISPFMLDAAGFFWSHYGIPIFTFPFNFVVLFFLYALGLAGYPLLTYSYKGSPERTLDYYLSFLARFPGTYRTLSLPVAGTWSVWQGFDGPWTHQGVWKYGIDFLITDEEGKTYRREGTFLEDYFCFQKPVLSPVRGRIVSMATEVEDNPPGVVNETQNWGNHVIIYDERGFYVLLAHFRKGSIQVKEGQWVERGQLLGLCGNSGYSPQPHVHVQVQFSPELGAPTQPFSFVHYAVEKNDHLFYKANDIPKTGEKIKGLYPEKTLEDLMSLLLDEEIFLEINVNGQSQVQVLTVGMSPEGTYFLKTQREKLYFNKTEGTFYFLRLDGSSPWLKAMFMACPRLPLVYQKGMVWEDFLPWEVVFDRIERAVLGLAASFNHNLAKVRGTYKFISPYEVEGKIQSRGKEIETYARIDHGQGFWAELKIKAKGDFIHIRRR